MRKRKFAVFLFFCALMFVLVSVQTGQCSLTPTLAWTASTDGDPATGYKLKYGFSSGNHPNEITLANVTSYTLPAALDPDRDYYYVVVGFNNDGDGPQSNELHYSTHDDDGDGLVNGIEFHLYGTDINLLDSDDNGYTDLQEIVLWGSNWDGDYDGDGVINILDPDDNGDGIYDGDFLSTPAYAGRTEDLSPELVLILLTTDE